MGTALFTLGSVLGAGMSYATQMSFSDVKTSDWFYADVQNMVEWDVIRGNPDGTFRPGATVNRAELSAMWNRYNSYLAKNYYSRAEIDALMKKGSVMPTTSTNTNAASQTGNAEASKTIALNSKGTLNGVSLTVSSVTDYSGGVFTPKAGMKFVVADVLIANNSGSTIAYNPFNFTLLDKSSYAYQMAVTDKAPGLNSGDLENGREVRGFISFELPADAQLKEMKYEVDYGKLGQFYVTLN